MILKTLNGQVLHGWQKELTDKGVPYYISVSHECNQWYHPEYVLLLQRCIQRYRTTRYTAYRTAQKLAFLQDALSVNNISLQSLVAAFACMGLSSTESNDDHITVEVTEALLQELYGESSCQQGKLARTGAADEVAKKGGGRGGQRSLVTNSSSLAGGIQDAATAGPDRVVCVELLTNLLLNLFDQSREGLLPVLGLKLVLCVLCAANVGLQHKHAYLHSQLADFNSAVTKCSVRRALQLLARLPELLGEELWFGRHLVAPALQGCFTHQAGSNVGLSEAEFCGWLRQEPQTLVWWSTLYRLRYASTVRHTGVECSGCCSASPCGLLYTCLQCVSYTLCQHCFLAGCTSHSHTAAHPMQEYCMQISAKERGRELLMRLGGRLRPSSSRLPASQRYLPLPGGLSQTTSSRVDSANNNKNAPAPSTPASLSSGCSAIASSASASLATASPAATITTTASPAATGATPAHPSPELLSRTISLHEVPPGGGYSCDHEGHMVHIRPSAAESLGPELQDKLRLHEPLKEVQPPDSYGGLARRPSNVQWEDQCKNKKKKKGLMTRLFNGGKTKKEKRYKVTDKENIELGSNSRSEEVGCPFTRAHSKSHSFGAGGSSKQVLNEQLSSLRYGSCRMNGRYSAASSSAAAASSHSTAAGPSRGGLRDASLLRIEQQNCTNQQQLRGEGGAVQEQAVQEDDSPRQQIEHIVRQLQDGYSALSNVSFNGRHTSSVVQQHTRQLSQHIAALRSLVQTLNSPVGVVSPRPRSLLPPHLPTSFESSTPIPAIPPACIPGGGRGLLWHGARPVQQSGRMAAPAAAAVGKRPVGDPDAAKGAVSWAALSPISCSGRHSARRLDDTASMDNRQNHQVEQPPVSERSLSRPPSAVAARTVSLQHEKEEHESRLSLRRSRLPSFTEVNFSDLTGSSQYLTRGLDEAPPATQGSQRGDRYSENCEVALRSCEAGNATFLGCDAAPAAPGAAAAECSTVLDGSCAELQLELEDILQQLGAMFPPAATARPSADCADVAYAAQELGDCLAEYVSSVPSAGGH